MSVSNELAIDDAIANINRIISGESMEGMLRNAAQPMLEHARRLAPVKTGELAHHINLVTRHTATTATALVQVSDSGEGGAAHEAVFAEFGTSHQRATPFMRPAFEAHKRAVLSAAEQYLINATSA